MVSYRTIQEHVTRRHGFRPNLAWIAHVLTDHGILHSVDHEGDHPAHRGDPCPTRHRPAIEDALRDFDILSRAT